MLPALLLSVLSRYAAPPLAPQVLAWMLALTPAAPWAESFPYTAQVIADAAEAHPLFAGPDGARRTAALLVVWGMHESRFDALAVGDHGAARGIWQPHVEHAPDSDLFDPAVNLDVALRLFRVSARVCRGRPEAERWAQYVAGRSCDDPRALRISRARSAEAERLLRGD